MSEPPISSSTSAGLAMLTAGVNWIAHAAMRSSAACSAALSRITARNCESSAEAAAAVMPGLTPHARAPALHATISARVPVELTTASGADTRAARS
jgi:hypothetical protein